MMNASSTDLIHRDRAHDEVAEIDAESGKVLALEASETTTAFHILRFSADGRYLIESGIRNSVEIWDGKHEHLLQEICAEPTSAAVSDDGRYLALGGGDPAARGG